MNRKKILAGIVIGGILIFGGWKLTRIIGQDEDTTTLTLYGNVDIRDVGLSFRVSGRIAEVLVDEGDHAAKGTILAALDKEPYDEEHAMAEAKLAEAEAALKNAERNFERRAALVKTGAVSRQHYDDSLAKRDESRARVLTAKVQVDQAETALKDTEIRAPSDGTVLTRVREPGSIVAPGQLVLTLAIDNRIWVRTYVDEPDLGRVYPSQPAKVFTDTRPDRPYQGHVGFISPQAEFTPKNVETTQLRTDLVYRLRVVVTNPDRGLRQGMPVTVRIDTKTRPPNNRDRSSDGR